MNPPNSRLVAGEAFPLIEAPVAAAMTNKATIPLKATSGPIVARAVVPASTALS